MLQNSFRIYLFLLLIILLGCNRGGNILMVGSISGPGEVPEGTTVEYSVDAEGDSGITYKWVLNPVGFGTLGSPTAASTTFTAPEVDTDFEIVIRVVVNSGNDGPVVRSLDVIVKDIAGPPDPPVNHPPIAAAHSSTYSTLTGVEIQFYDDSTDPDGESDIVLWEWDFSFDPNDGFQVDSTEKDPFHIYFDVGTWHVQLKVTNSGGLEDLLDEPLEITISSPIPYNLQEVGLAGTRFRLNDVAMSGDYAYIAENEGLLVIDISGGQNFIRASRLSLAEGATRIVLEGNIAYLINTEIYEPDLHIINIEDPGSPQKITSFALKYICTDLAIQDGILYVPLESIGVRVIDVTNPEDPQILTTVWTGGKLSLIAVDGQYCVVSNIYSSNLQYLLIVDISIPANAQIVKTLKVWNLEFYLTISNGYAFKIGASSFVVYDIDPPETAHWVLNKNVQGDIYGFAQDENNIYVATENEIITYDFDYDSTELSLINSVSLPKDQPMALVLENNLLAYLYAGRLIIQEITAPGTFENYGSMSSIGDVKDVEFSNDHLFIAAGGLHVYGIQNPANPVYSGANVDMSETRARLEIVDQFAYVIYGRESINKSYLNSYDINNYGSPQAIGYSFDLFGRWPADCVYKNGFLYTVTSSYYGLEDSALKIYDIQQDGLLDQVGRLFMDQSSTDVVVSDNFAFISSDREPAYGIYTVDISSALHSEIIHEVFSTVPVKSVDICGNYLYAAGYNDNESRLEAYRIAPSGALEFVSHVLTEGYSKSIVVLDSFAYIANFQGLQVFDVRDPENMIPVASYSTPGSCVNLDVTSDYAYLCDLEYGVRIVSLH